MKRLILIRHAKSSWSSGASDDQSRPLNDRGRAAAAKVGNWLNAQGYLPSQVMSSNAARCAETWEGIAPMLSNSPEEVSFQSELYLAGPQTMLEALKAAKQDTVLMLGHMPGIGEFARDLRRDPPPAHEAFSKYPTCAVTVLDFKAENWSEVQMGTGKFVAYAAPRDLP